MSGPPWTGAAFAYISRLAAVLLLAPLLPPCVLDEY